LQFLFKPLLKIAGVSLPNTASVICPTTGGVVFEDPNWFQMDFALWVYQPNIQHPRPAGQGISSNTWIEVLHNAFWMDGEATWFYYTPGSGVFMYTGNTAVYKDHDEATKNLLNEPCKGTGHNECVPQFGALYKAGIKAGLDSLQFWDHGDMQCGPQGAGGAIPQMLLALEIVDLKGPGTHSCSQVTAAGPTRFKAGWEGKTVCNCDNAFTTINCDGYGMRHKQVR
jgi:hypothetical protein